MSAGVSRAGINTEVEAAPPEAAHLTALRFHARKFGTITLTGKKTTGAIADIGYQAGDCQDV